MSKGWLTPGPLKLVTAPAGVMRVIESAEPPVYQMLPSGPVVIWLGEIALNIVTVPTAPAPDGAAGPAIDHTPTTSATAATRPVVFEKIVRMACPPGSPAKSLGGPPIG